MSANQPRQTLADYLVIVISPVLIMALVGSLVFFLVEILYAGEYGGRMRWIMFFFVFAAVLIARISMIDEIANRASLYGLILGVLVWIGLVQFVKYPPGTMLAMFAPFINLLLMVLIWWSAHRLTWDCTYIDDSAEATGQGVLQAAGLETGQEPTRTETPAETKAAAKKEGLAGWFERYNRYQAERRSKHTPGVWVVYFSLAALPLFGLGQTLISPAETERRRYVFWLLGIYVASGLALLLTTAFLGLRCYLRQRGLQMPKAVVGVWLSLGTVLIVALLVVGVLLPRPNAEVRLVSFRQTDSPERDASRLAQQRDSAGKGDGQPSSDTAERQKDGADQRGGQGEGKGGDGSGKQGGGKDQARASGKDGSGKGSKSGSGEGKDQQGNDDKDGQQGSRSDQSKQGEENDPNRGTSNGRDAKQSSSTSSNSSSSGGSSKTPSMPPDAASGLTGALSGPLKFLQYVVFGVLAAVAIIVLLMAVLKFMANFTGWAKGLLDSLRALWESLFGTPPRSERDEPEEELPSGPAPPPPFTAFTNPFLDGRAERLPPDELIRYSFSALQSWAWDRDLGRESGETPMEFTQRVGRELPGMETEVRQLGLLYARTVYSRSPLPAGYQEAVRQFWQRLGAVSEQPLSA